MIRKIDDPEAEDGSRAIPMLKSYAVFHASQVDGLVWNRIERDGLRFLTHAEAGYVLADLTCHESPLGWAQKAIDAYDFWKADMIIGEGNNGGDLIESNIKTVRRFVPYRKVTASRGPGLLRLVRALAVETHENWIESMQVPQHGTAG